MLLPVTLLLPQLFGWTVIEETQDCQLFSKNIKLVLLTLKEGRKFAGLELAKKRILFIARTLLDNTTKKCEQVYIGPILIYYYCFMSDHRGRKRELVFVSDLYF